jgi:probable phosphoglycerate mutase
MKTSELWQPPRRRRVYLMRHGEVDYFDEHGRPYRPDGVPLNVEGRLQAEAAGRALADVPLDLVVISGLVRTRQTAELVLAGRGLQPVVRPDLREIEPGRLSRLKEATAAEIERAFLGALDGEVTPESTFLGGETFGALRHRAWPCFQELLAERSWSQLLIVAHGVLNRVLLGTVLGLPLTSLGALEQDAGCLNVIDFDDAGRGVVRLVNHTPLSPLKAGVMSTTMERLYLQYLRGRVR